MFGYVVINKPEMKIKDFDIYQSFYCGLCQNLANEQGRLGQIALSYDMTFLAILLSALYEPEEDLKTYRCLLHPAHTHTLRQNKYTSYASDMTILLTYLKCSDDWEDDHSHSKRMYQRLLKRRFLHIKQKYTDKVKRIEDALAENNRLEKEQVYDLDRLASLSGIMMAEIFTYQQDFWHDVLYRFGDYLGRYIYLLDAYDDLMMDKEKGHFNVLYQEEKRADFEIRMKQNLEMMIAQSCDAFEQLPILKYCDILRNILYSGVWSKYEAAKKKRIGEENE